jgi:hypothetical protein
VTIDTIFTAVATGVGAATAAAGNADWITPEAIVLVGGGIIFAFAGIMGRQMITDVRTTRDAVMQADLPALRTDVDKVKGGLEEVRGEWGAFREQFATDFRGALDEVITIAKDAKKPCPPPRSRRRGGSQ